jgi:hypothetical protein
VGSGSEEVSKVATGAIDAMRTQPLAIALVIINAMFLALGMWLLSRINDQYEKSAIRRDGMLAEMARTCAQCPRPTRMIVVQAEPNRRKPDDLSIDER